MLATLLLCLGLVHLGTQQTFQYSRGWTNGKRSFEQYPKPRVFHFVPDSDRYSPAPTFGRFSLNLKSFRSLSSMEQPDPNSIPTFGVLFKDGEDEKSDAIVPPPDDEKESIGYIYGQRLPLKFSNKISKRK